MVHFAPPALTPRNLAVPIRRAYDATRRWVLKKSTSIFRLGRVKSAASTSRLYVRGAEADVAYDFTIGEAILECLEIVSRRCC